MDPLTILTTDGNVPTALALIVIQLVALRFMYSENKKQISAVKEQINAVKDELSVRISEMDSKVSTVESETKKKVATIEHLQRADSVTITAMHTDIRWIKQALERIEKK